jgi:bifunctional DNA-binding transcriptional regulator/antitoxin component of YhaV-PrlF toxin-antitoxin module
MSSKITGKGQITVPKEIRKILNSNVIEFEIAGDMVLLKPVKSVAGGLRKYAKRHVPLSEVRESVWGEVAKEKFKR